MCYIDKKEDGSFNTAPNSLVKDDKIMMVQYVLAILLIIAMIVLDLYKSANGFSNIEPFHINRCGGVFVVLLVMGFFLYNTVKYNVKRYNLPETWRKKN